MKLKRVYGFDYLLVLLSRDVQLYRKDGTPLYVWQLAQTQFGEVKMMMDYGDICEEDK